VEQPFAAHIQKTAADYVMTYFPKYYLDTLQVPEKEDLSLDFSIREKWLSISIYNRSAKADQYRWDFGDGKTSTKRHPKHYYAKAGKYTVTLYIKKECHWYKLKQSVKVSDKVKYANHATEPNGTSNH
jgi:hypothetical protein